MAEKGIREYDAGHPYRATRFLQRILQCTPTGNPLCLSPWQALSSAREDDGDGRLGQYNWRVQSARSDFGK